MVTQKNVLINSYYSEVDDQRINQLANGNVMKMVSKLEGFVVDSKSTHFHVKTNLMIRIVGVQVSEYSISFL